MDKKTCPVCQQDYEGDEESLFCSEACEWQFIELTDNFFGMED